MSYNEQTGYCTCERCGHNWYAKVFNYTFRKPQKPRACANCKNTGWDKPRVYAVNGLSGTLAKRYKSTWKKPDETNDNTMTK